MHTAGIAEVTLQVSRGHNAGQHRSYSWDSKGHTAGRYKRSSMTNTLVKKLRLLAN